MAALDLNHENIRLLGIQESIYKFLYRNVCKQTFISRYVNAYNRNKIGDGNGMISVNV